MNTILEKNLLSCHEFSENLKRWYNKPINMEDIEYPFEENEEEKEESEGEDTNENPPVDLVAYSEARSCFELMRLNGEGQLEIAPDFQRGFVWNYPQQSRFVDSLIKGLPIPSLCISFDYKLNKRQVIDGRQRIQTIINFLTKDGYTLSQLEDIDDKISGKSVFDIKRDNRVLYDRVANTAIPVTVIRCDSMKPSHNRYLFKIFHRLNSGGVKLSNQEIRNCIYNGLFNTYLRKTTNYPEYIKLMNINTEKDPVTGESKYYKYAFEELNLRFFAFYEELERDKEMKNYTGKLITFLNDYMMNIKLKESTEGTDVINKDIEKKDDLFRKTIKLIHDNINTLEVHKVKKAMVEALFIGVSLNLDFFNEKIAATDLKKTMEYFFEKLRNDSSIKETLQGGIAQKANVIKRLNRAKDIFAGME